MPATELRITALPPHEAAQVSRWSIFRVLSWSLPARVMLVSGLTLPFATAWWLRMVLLRGLPTTSTYVSRSFLPTMIGFLGFQASAHALLIVASLVARLRGTNGKWLMHAEIQLWFACTAFSLYVLGPLTTSMSVMLLVLPVVGYLFFDRRAMHLGLATGLTGTAVGIALPLAGLAPYAPFLAHAPYRDGQLDVTWIISQGVPTFFAAGLGLAVFIAVFGQLAKRQRELEHLSSTDMLTGLANRRVFYAQLIAEAARARRYGHALSVLMLDVDHFKRINDTHGHATGDEVLRALGRVIREGLRLGDVAARHGGEEIGVVLPHTPEEGAHAVAARLLAAVREIRLPDGARVTASIGHAALDEGETEDALVARADEALYEAKRAGRDRVSAAKTKPRAARPDERSDPTSRGSAA